MQFHEKLQELRKEKKLSQEDLAEMLDVTRQSVSKWEGGYSYPETDKLIAISEIFGVTLDSLLKDVEEVAKEDPDNIHSNPFWLTRGRYFEYKSKRTAFGMPLVHVCIGFTRKKAKGVLAIGMIAQGILAIGLLSMGILSFGVLGLGLIGVGVLGVGALAIGSIAVGAISIGAIAFGLLTLGAVSIGMYSVGAVAVASRVAIGDHAYAPIAVGRVVSGVYEFVDTSARGNFAYIDAQEVRTAIESKFPGTWDWVKNWITWFIGR